MVKKYTENEINKLVNILENDGIISVPTDTVYGLCAKITSKKAHDKLIQTKNRPKEKAFPVMCANINQIEKVAILNENAKEIIQNFMPGPITLILKKEERVPLYVTNGKNTIAIRMATSKVLKKLILKLDSPVFMTSANLSGKPECSNVNDIENAFPFLDGMLAGNIVYGKASTIVDCSNEEKISIVREGPITQEQIEACLQH